MSDFPFKSITAEQVAALRAASPGDDIKPFIVYPMLDDVVDTSVDPMEIMARVPRGTPWEMFQAALRDDVKRATAGHNLILACVVHPPRPELERLLQLFPGTERPIMALLSEMAGNTAKVERVRL